MWDLQPRTAALTLVLVLGAMGCSSSHAGVPQYPAMAVTSEADARVGAVASQQAVRQAAPAGELETSYADAASRIAELASADRTAYTLLRELCDTVGHRLVGTPELDRALQWAKAQLAAAGHEAVAIEPVKIPYWERGAESLRMVAPVKRELSVLGLGGSVATPRKGITAEVVVVRSMKEVEKLGDRARGKILLFDVPMPAHDPVTRDPGYGAVVGVRVGGAKVAAEKGAVAALVRSLTAHSLGAPHTGMMAYGDAKVRIPTAAVSVEDSAWIARQVEAGVKVTLTLKLSPRDRGLVPSGNVVAELRGREKPDEYVLIGGHIDSWDVGQGAHDNGSGIVIAMAALRLLRLHKLVPRRTVRVVLWTSEENGSFGAKGYAAQHAAELSNTVAAIESDSGGDRVLQLNLDVPDAHRGHARGLLDQLQRLLAPLGVDRVNDGFAGADTRPLAKQGVAAIGLRHDMSRYFDFHHSAADTFDKIDPEQLAQGVAVMATAAYVLADMPERLVPTGKAAEKKPEKKPDKKPDKKPEL